LPVDISAGVQKCSHALKLGVHECLIFYFYFIHMNAVCVHYKKFLCTNNIHRKFCTPALVWKPHGDIAININLAVSW